MACNYANFHEDSAVKYLYDFVRSRKIADKHGTPHSRERKRGIRVIRNCTGVKRSQYCKSGKITAHNTI